MAQWPPLRTLVIVTICWEIANAWYTTLLVALTLQHYSSFSAKIVRVCDARPTAG